tara:strand:- start:933 stop:1118 length:186 start_codon:yes stop_codon:yes gene_type:complete
MNKYLILSLTFLLFLIITSDNILAKSGNVNNSNDLNYETSLLLKNKKFSSFDFDISINKLK